MMMTTTQIIGAVALTVLLSVAPRALAFSGPSTRRASHYPTTTFLASSNDSNDNGELSRRDLFLLGTGGVVYAKLVGDALSRLARGNKYPVEHEQQVQNTFRTAILTAAKATASASETTSRRPLRILEVGVGPDCRAASRGLYGPAMDELLLLASNGGAKKTTSDIFPFSGVEIVGVDLKAPSANAIEKARESLVHPKGCILPSFRISFDAQQGDVAKGLSYPDGSFDCVLCSLTLCSVEDQSVALKEIRRLVQPKGGTFGYIEHVAVDLDKDPNREFLEWQQRVLDPVQQVVADNCHLHRYTQVAVEGAFGINNQRQQQQAKVIEQNQFFVDGMWPVSYQCSGVVQRTV